MLAVLLTGAFSWENVHAQCIDYGDYLHQIGGLDTAGSVSDVAVSGSFAFVADGASGLLVVDVADPANPRFIGSVGIAGSGRARDVVVTGDHAYVADGTHGFQVIACAHPASARTVGSRPSANWLADVVVSGDHAFVANFNMVGTGSILVVDATNPAEPWQVGPLDTPGDDRGVAVRDPYAYVAGGGCRRPST